MTTWGSRSSGSPTTTVSGTREAAARTSATRARVRAASADRRRPGLLPRLGGRQRERHPRADVGASVLDVGARTRPLPPHPLADDEHAQRGTAPRPGVADEHVPGVRARRRAPGSPSRRRRAVCREPGRPRGRPRAAAGCRPRRWRSAGPRRPCPARRSRAARRRGRRGRAGRPAPRRAGRRRRRRRRAAARARAGTRTAECSTAEATVRAPRRRAAYRTPSTARSSAVGPLGRKLTSAGRTPRPVAMTSRERSSRARAVRPSACSRSGSAHPAETAATSVSRATGCSGPEAASRRRRRAPETGAAGGPTFVPGS